jgi:multidrug efflux pump subunit AcrA (membrane-fusion protein)
MRFLVSALVLLLLPTAHAQAAESTVLSGKLYCPVTRIVTLPFTGIVGSIDVAPGQRVKKDDVLLHYSLEEKAANALEKELTLGAKTEELQGQIVDLERQVLEMKSNIATSRQLVSSKLGSRSTLQQQEETLDALNRRIRLLRESIKKQEQIYTLRLNELEDSFKQPIQGQRPPQALFVTSPMAGFVLSVAENVQSGALIAAGTAIAEIGSMNPMQIRVQVFENEAVRLKEGESAIVRVPSLQDREYVGKIMQIAWTPQALQTDAPSFYNVQLEVPNDDLALKQGFKALVRFTDASASSAGK